MPFIILFLGSCISLASASDDVSAIEMEEGRHKAKPYFIPTNSPLERSSAKVAPHTMESTPQVHVPSYKVRMITATPFFITGIGALLSIIDILTADSPLEGKRLKLASDSFWFAASITGVTIKSLGF